MSNPRRGWTIIDILVHLGVLLAIVGIIVVTINPDDRLGESRNEQRRSDIALIADAIDQYTRDRGETLYREIPRGENGKIEICGDTKTGSCTNLLSINPLMGRYLHIIPRDPLVQDPDTPIERTWYFVHRTMEGRIAVTASGTELGLPPLTAIR